METLFGGQKRCLYEPKFSLKFRAVKLRVGEDFGASKSTCKALCWRSHENLDF